MYVNVNNPSQVIEDMYTSLENEAADLTARHTLVRETVLPLLKDLMELPSWGDVRVLALYRRSLYLYLRADRKDSPLPREITQAFHVRGDKSVVVDDALSVKFHFPAHRLHMMVEGYLPATCRIERIEEYIPAHMGYVNKIVCTGGEESEELE